MEADLHLGRNFPAKFALPSIANMDEKGHRDLMTKDGRAQINFDREVKSVIGGLSATVWNSGPFRQPDMRMLACIHLPKPLS